MTIDRQATPPTHSRQRLKQSDPTEKEDSKPSNYKQIQRNGRGNGATKWQLEKFKELLK